MKIYNTRQKDILISFLKENKQHHFSINEISEEICKHNIGKSTVYRLIKQLTSEGILRCFYNEEHKVTLYQYADKHQGCDSHFHLKCSNCNKIIHLECDHTKELKEHISAMHNFNIDVNKTILYGYCESCRNRGTDL